MIADIARFGGDKIVISLWDNLTLYGLYVYTYQGIDQTIKKLKEISRETKHKDLRTILVDEGGVGGGVVDGMRGIKGYNGNSSPLKIWDYTKNRQVSANYQNFRSQCLFKLAEMVNDRKIRINITLFETNIEGYNKEKAISDMMEELDQIKQTDNSMDGKKAIIPKSKIKEQLGRSPDFADVMMMRMHYELVELPFDYKPDLIFRGKDPEEINEAI